MFYTVRTNYSMVMDSKNYCCIRYLNPPNMFPIFIYAFFFFFKDVSGGAFCALAFLEFSCSDLMIVYC